MFWFVDPGIAAAIAVAAAQPIPAFDIERHCREIAARSAPIGDVEPCLRDEREARARLVAEWERFAPADRAHCLQLARIGVDPTYTELLTCLDVAREARAARSKGQGETTGQGR